MCASGWLFLYDIISRRYKFIDTFFHYFHAFQRNTEVKGSVIIVMCVTEAHKSRHHVFSCRSLLLSTTIFNDLRYLVMCKVVKLMLYHLYIRKSGTI